MKNQSLIDLLETYLGKSQKTNKEEEILFFCPKCCSGHFKPYPSTWKPHFAVNIFRGLAHCWVCEFGISAKLEETSSNALKRMLRVLGYTEIKLEDERFIEDRDIDHLFEKLQEIKETVKIQDHYKKIYKYRDSFMYKIGYNFLKRRNISDDDMIKYDIRYSVVSQRILFPSYNNNFELNYFVTRTVYDNVFPKYINCITKKTGVIFNEFLIDWKKELFLTEGIFDYISIKRNATPLLGCQLSKNSELFKKLIKYRTPVNLLLDHDMRKRTFKTVKFLSSYGINTKYFDWKNLDKDIDEFSEEDREFFLTHNIKENDIESEILFSLTS